MDFTVAALNVKAQQNDKMLMMPITLAKTVASPLDRMISVGTVAAISRFPTITSQHRATPSRRRICNTFTE